MSTTREELEAKLNGLENDLEDTHEQIEELEEARADDLLVRDAIRKEHDAWHQAAWRWCPDAICTVASKAEREGM